MTIDTIEEIIHYCKYMLKINPLHKAHAQTYTNYNNKNCCRFNKNNIFKHYPNILFAICTILIP